MALGYLKAYALERRTKRQSRRVAGRFMAATFAPWRRGWPEARRGGTGGQQSPTVA